MPSTPAIPILISTSIQGTAMAVVALSSFLIATRELPAVPDVHAFGTPTAFELTVSLWFHFDGKRKSRT